MDRGPERNAWPVTATLLSTVLAGFAPILGKYAYRAGVPPTTLVALRTALAAGLLWAFYVLFWRRYIRIERRYLLGCLGMGLFNGLGSLLYYNGLSRMDASLAHLLYAMYPFWVFIFLSAAGHPVSRLAVLRLGLALFSVFLLTWQGGGLVDPLGVTLMIGAGTLYGWHLVLGQWTLADVDSRTVTLYGLTAMAGVVVLAGLTQPQGLAVADVSAQGWLVIVLLAVFPTALARLLVFTGLSRLGGVQTALLSIAEVLVAVAAAFVLLGERFTLQQWLGAAVFMVSVLLISRDTGLQVTDEEAWWRSLFPTPSEGESPDRGTPDDGSRG
jgi:drug/metabolite transporter (DMT)-like permease